MAKASTKTFTLRDVARLAGVSVATVSAVANKKGTAGEEAIKRVEEAMSRLDYRPDPHARSLKTGRSYAIGLVVPDVANPFFTETMGGVEAMARAHGYSVFLTNSNEDPEQEVQNIRSLHSRRVDGILLATSSGRANYSLNLLHRCPIVFMDRLPSQGVSGSSVIVDNVRAAYEGTRHLIELGHRDIAVIAGRLDFSAGAGRLEGFRQMMEEAGIPVASSYVQVGDFRPESGYECGCRLLDLPKPPTAIFACNNSMTLGLMRALAERKFACPERVSVLGFDDFPWAAYFRPRLTSIAQPTFELGSQAMKLLLEIIEAKARRDDDLPYRQIMLPAELRVRESTGAPPLR